MRGGALRATWRPPSPRPVVAPRVWCKSHGRRLGLMMQRGSCERPVCHLPLRARRRRPEQIVAQVLKLADELGTISTARQPHEAWSRPAKTSERQDRSPGSRPITFFGTVRLRTKVPTGPHSRSAGLALADTLLRSAEDRWRSGTAPTSWPSSVRMRPSERGWWSSHTERLKGRRVTGGAGQSITVGGSSGGRTESANAQNEAFDRPGPAVAQDPVSDDRVGHLRILPRHPECPSVCRRGGDQAASNGIGVAPVRRPSEPDASGPRAVAMSSTPL
jgi:hypothetical protein